MSEEKKKVEAKGNPLKLVATARGYYDGRLIEEGEVFDNTLDLPVEYARGDGIVRPTWFKAAGKPPATEFV